MRRAGGLLAIAVLLETSASLALQAAVHDPGWYVPVAVGYAAAYALLRLVLKSGIPLAAAYCVWGAGGVALTAFGASLIYSETITVSMWIGLGFVIVGVLCLELDTRKHLHGQS